MLSDIIQKCLENSKSFALWKMPQGVTKELFIDTNFQEQEIVFEKLPTCFTFSPFEGKNLVIQAKLSFKFNLKDELLSGNNLEDFKLFLEKHQKSGNFKEKSSYTFKETEEDYFKESVQKALESFKNSALQKVVLSKVKIRKLPENFKLEEVFTKLCEQYPNAFVSLVFLSNTNEIWLGATPETLVSINKEGIFKTMSLAGTQANIGVPAAEIRWSQKDIEEQAFVSRYIIECFKSIRLREYIENGPKTIQAGNLMHLRTDYSVDTKALGIPNLGSTMTALLHPTSAVCGTPKALAKIFINFHEKHQREYYSGFLGPINNEGETNLFVNLRTMKIADQNAIFFAGCGITEDSDPNKEWIETEMKCQTLMNLIDWEN